MRSNPVTSRSILALTLCGSLLAVSCMVDPSPAAARGFGRMGGGARSFGGMRGSHQTSGNIGRTNTYSGRTNTYSTTNRNCSVVTGSNKTGSNSGSSKTGSNSSGKTNTVGTVNNSTANTSGTNTGSRTTSTTTSSTTTSSRAGNTPGTPGNTVSVPVLSVGSNSPGARRGGGGGGVPGLLMPNLPPAAIGLGAGGGIGAGGAGGSGAGGNATGGGGGGGGGNANAAASGVPPQGEQRFVPDEIVLGFSSSATQQQIDEIALRYGVTRLGSQSFPLIDLTLYRWRIGAGRSLVDTIGAVENESLVASAQPNYLFTLQEDGATASSSASSDAGSGTSNDAGQYVLGKLQIEQAHQVATGKNISIAVIDSEIDANHPDLAGAIAKSFDALGGDETPQSHGTAMAGAIAAHGKLSGIAFGPHLLAARAFDNSAGGAKATSFAIYKSLQWAADNGARVINMSFAGPADPTMHRMLTAAYDKGIVLIAAAGNAGPKSAPLYPAADPEVIAVTATDSNDGLFNMANRGSYIAVAAPGVEILALAPGDAYQVTTGTSVAAAHVSGIAAMLLEEKPSLTPAEIRSIIMSTAKPLGSSGQQADFGAGLADAYQAVTSLNGKPAGKEEAEQTKE